MYQVWIWLYVQKYNKAIRQAFPLHSSLISSLVKINSGNSMNIALGKGCEKELQVQMKKVGNHFEEFHTSKNLAGFAGQKINIF